MQGSRGANSLCGEQAPPGPGAEGRGAGGLGTEGGDGERGQPDAGESWRRGGGECRRGGRLERQEEDVLWHEPRRKNFKRHDVGGLVVSSKWTLSGCVPGDIHLSFRECHCGCQWKSWTNQCGHCVTSHRIQMATACRGFLCSSQGSGLDHAQTDPRDEGLNSACDRSFISTSYRRP